MSWISNETGRPKEDGGHQRIDISADYYTRQTLDHVGNKSNFVEHSIRVFTESKCIHFEKLEETVNTSRFFRDAVIFEVAPFFTHNIVEQVNVSFSFLSNDGGIDFRVAINDNKGKILVEKSPSREYCLSHQYNLGQLGLKRFEAMLRGKDKYIFRFQHRPITSFGEAYVKNINVFIDLIESPFVSFSLEEKNEKEYAGRAEGGKIKF